MTMLIKESYVNEDEGYSFGESGWYESWTEDLGKLFTSLQKEYGRCQSKVFVDTPDGTKQVGWYFQKRMQYEDARPTDKDRFYTRGVWVSYQLDMFECHGCKILFPIDDKVDESNYCFHCAEYHGF